VMIDTTYEKFPNIPNDSIARQQVDSSGNKNDYQEERVIDINNYVFESEIARQSTIKESKNVSREGKSGLTGDRIIRDVWELLISCIYHHFF